MWVGLDVDWLWASVGCCVIGLVRVKGPKNRVGLDCGFGLG